jgi:hypothetical protein
MRFRPSFALLLFLPLISHGADHPLKISIVPDQFSPQGQDQTLDLQGKCYVVLTNVSDKPIKILEDWNMWGWFNLSFQATDGKGVAHPIQRKGGYDFTRNFPGTFLIAPGESCIREAKWKDWTGFEDIPWNERKILLTASFQEFGFEKGSALTEIVAKDVWVGKAESKPCPFILP